MNKTHAPFQMFNYLSVSIRRKKAYEKKEYSCEYYNCALHTKVLRQLHANLWANSAVIWHSTAQNIQISGLSSFLTWVVKSARRVFITNHHTDLFAFTQNQQKKEYDSWIIAVHKRCLKPWSVSSTERKMSDRELPGNACWQDKVETRLHVRGKGEDVRFVLCSLWMAPRSSQMSSKTVLKHSDQKQKL